MRHVLLRFLVVGGRRIPSRQCIGQFKEWEQSWPQEATPFAISRSMDERLRMFVVGTEAKFVKRAKGRITFTCNDIAKAREAIEESLSTGEAVEIDLNSQGKDSTGDIVSEWVFKWNLLVTNAE